MTVTILAMSSALLDGANIGVKKGVKMDLIDRQAAIDAMTNTLWHYPNECYRNLNEYEFAKGLSELGLKSVPSAQYEIIHCKDCKYYKSFEYTGFLACHYTVGGMVRRHADDFCSRAERINDA